MVHARSGTLPARPHRRLGTIFQAPWICRAVTLHAELVGCKPGRPLDEPLISARSQYYSFHTEIAPRSKARQEVTQAQIRLAQCAQHRPYISMEPGIVPGRRCGRAGFRTAHGPAEASKRRVESLGHNRDSCGHGAWPGYRFVTRFFGICTDCNHT